LWVVRSTFFVSQPLQFLLINIKILLFLKYSTFKDFNFYLHMKILFSNDVK